METIKNIVLAKEANCKSDEVLQYGLQLANELNAKLTIGFCYPSEAHSLEMSGYRESPVREAFQYVKGAYLEQTDVNYRLVSCETQICDKADEALNIFLPDLFLVDKTLVRDLYTFIDRVHCPLLLLPENISYQPMKHMLVIDDFNGKDDMKNLRYMHQLSKLFNISFEMMDYEDFDPQLLNKSNKSSRIKSDKGESRLFAHNAHQMTAPDMLVMMVKDKFFGLMKSFYGPLIEQLKDINLPVLIYKV